MFLVHVATFFSGIKVPILFQPVIFTQLPLSSKEVRLDVVMV